MVTKQAADGSKNVGFELTGNFIFYGFYRQNVVGGTD